MRPRILGAISRTLKPRDSRAEPVSFSTAPLIAGPSRCLAELAEACSKDPVTLIAQLARAGDATATRRQKPIHVRTPADTLQPTRPSGPERETPLKVETSADASPTPYLHASASSGATPAPHRPKLLIRDPVTANRTSKHSGALAHTQDAMERNQDKARNSASSGKKLSTSTRAPRRTRALCLPSASLIACMPLARQPQAKMSA